MIDSGLVMDALGAAWPIGMQMRHCGESGLYMCHDEHDVWWCPIEDGIPGKAEAVEWRNCTFTLVGGVAFELATRLDEWERGGCRYGNPNDITWAEAVADPIGRAAAIEEMIARITHIGLDARIRRALGEEPKAGTLATLEHFPQGAGNWRLTQDSPPRVQWFSGWLQVEPDADPEGAGCLHVPGLASYADPDGITDIAEALQAIADKVAP